MRSIAFWLFVQRQWDVAAERQRGMESAHQPHHPMKLHDTADVSWTVTLKTDSVCLSNVGQPVDEAAAEQS
jgi:hypothetical protein